MAKRFSEGLKAVEAGVKEGDCFLVIGGNAAVGKKVWLVEDDNSRCPYFSTAGPNGNQDYCLRFEHLELIEEGDIVEEVKKPAGFVRLERNTELFKKGTVFKIYSSQAYSAINEGDSLIDGYTGHESYKINIATVQRLTNIFVPVEKFNPEYVTAEENDALQAVLKKKTVKKAVKKAKK